MLAARLDALLGAPRPHAPNSEMPHRAVGDPEHPRDLLEGLRVRVEMQEVVGPLGLLVDLVGELAPAPALLPNPGPAPLLDEVADARDDLVLALVGQLGIEHEHDF